MLMRAYINIFYFILNFGLLRWVKHKSKIGDAQVSSPFYRDWGPLRGTVTGVDVQASG